MLTNGTARRFLLWLVFAWMSFSSVVMASIVLVELATVFGGGAVIFIIGFSALCTLYLGAQIDKEKVG